MAAVASRGLPPLLALARSPLAPAPTLPPPLVIARAAGLVLEARVVDFYAGSQGTRNSIHTWLQDLGFNVTVTADQVQIGPVCGYVAARATNLMYAAGEQFCAVDVGDAADEQWIELGNAVLENDEVVAVFLEGRT